MARRSNSQSPFRLLTYFQSRKASLMSIQLLWRAVLLQRIFWGPIRRRKAHAESLSLPKKWLTSVKIEPSVRHNQRQAHYLLSHRGRSKRQNSTCTKTKRKWIPEGKQWPFGWVRTDFTSVFKLSFYKVKSIWQQRWGRESKFSCFNSIQEIRQHAIRSLRIE